MDGARREALARAGFAEQQDGGISPTIKPAVSGRMFTIFSVSAATGSLPSFDVSIQHRHTRTSMGGANCKSKHCDMARPDRQQIC
jgi:hypothetical protein